MNEFGVSVLILTLDEENNLPQCLKSVMWCDDVVVLDSYSTDGTQQIAETGGARFVQRVFDNYAAQRNYGLNDIAYKNPWVFMIDADEQVPEELVQEIQSVMKTGNGEISLYRLRRKDYFQGRWIKHSSGYPTWFGRLLKVGNVHVEREINEEYVTDGEVGLLEGHLIHYPFNKGFSSWLEKHNRYSSMEAKLMVSGGLASFAWSDLLNSDPQIKRKALKSIIYRLPGRPFIMFFSLYFLRGGILEGKAGFTFCMLRAFYEFMINCKVNEYRRRDKGLNL